MIHLSFYVYLKKIRLNQNFLLQWRVLNKFKIDERNSFGVIKIFKKYNFYQCLNKYLSFSTVIKDWV